MISDHLKITDGAVAGAWIRPRLEGDFSAVTHQVPKDFEAYARIFHPALDSKGDRVRWAQAAKECGTTPHRKMQWHAVVGLDSPNGAKWAGSDPPTGAMDIETLDVLCEILSVHTVDSDHCFFGLCMIESWLDSFSADELQPLLKLPCDRDHIVLAGSLSVVEQITYDWSKSSSTRMIFTASEGEQPPSEPDPSESLRREAPNLIWPANRTWLVTSDVDFDSTLVGGSAKLIEAIVESPELEAWQVEPTDSLAADADKVNIVSED